MKCQTGLAALNRDSDSKKFKRDNLQSILDNFIKDGYLTFLENEINDEQARVQSYKDLHKELTL